MNRKEKTAMRTTGPLFVLAVLERRREALDRAIAALIELRSSEEAAEVALAVAGEMMTNARNADIARLRAVDTSIIACEKRC